MPARIFIAAAALLLPACACGQTVADASAAAADNLAVHRLLDQYAQAVDTVDLKLLAQIWSHSPDVSFIYPLGQEHGFDALRRMSSRRSWTECSQRATSRKFLRVAKVRLQSPGPVAENRQGSMTLRGLH